MDISYIVLGVWVILCVLLNEWYHNRKTHIESVSNMYTEYHNLCRVYVNKHINSDNWESPYDWTGMPPIEVPLKSKKPPKLEVWLDKEVLERLKS